MLLFRGSFILTINLLKKIYFGNKGLELINSAYFKTYQCEYETISLELACGSTFLKVLSRCHTAPYKIM